MSLTVTQRKEGCAVVVVPDGRIDQSSAESFQAALTPYLKACTAGAAPVVLDLSSVSYISSIGLRVLMLAARQVAAQKGKLAIACLTPMVLEVFEISRLNLVFQVFDSANAAAEALAG